MDSSISFENRKDNKKYKSRKKDQNDRRSRDKYLNKKRERSPSNKKEAEKTRKLKDENRSYNRINSFGRHKPETDYIKNKNKYRYLDVKLDVYSIRHSDKHRLKGSKYKFKNDRDRKRVYSDSKSVSRRREAYSPSESEDSRDKRHNRKHRYTYSTKNSDYSLEKRRHKKSYSGRSRKRSYSCYKRPEKKRSNYNDRNKKIKFCDFDNSSYDDKYKSFQRDKKRDYKRKRSRSSYYRYRQKKRSKSYSLDRDHSYSRLRYHKSGKHKEERKDNKKELKDYSKDKQRNSYSSYYSESRSHSSNQSSSVSRRSSTNSVRSYSGYSSSSGGSKRNKDEGHYEFKVGNVLNNKYKIIGLLGDGTFGRCLECLNLEDNITYGVKVIRPVPRYIDSAKYEADIILEILRADSNNESKTVNLLEYFYFEEKRQKYIALVFEKLGKSLYEFIKGNDYKGFSIQHIQDMTRQILEGIAFIHDRLKIVHTDLKPENILLKNDEAIQIKEKNEWPLNVILKENKLQKSKSPSTRSYSREKHDEVYLVPMESAIKIIDFGGATRENERHSEIVNTRQYRAPEVILSCYQWNEKSDIWCLACIFSELYTGELLFPTHNNEEHLSLIEKVSGPIPLWMANNAKKEFRRIFDLDFHGVDDRYKVNFEKIYGKRDEIIANYQKLETLEDLIPEEHIVFRDFLQKLLIVDPNKRPSCREALEHQFFRTKF